MIQGPGPPASRGEPVRGRPPGKEFGRRGARGRTLYQWVRRTLNQWVKVARPSAAIALPAQLALPDAVKTLIAPVFAANSVHEPVHEPLPPARAPIT